MSPHSRIQSFCWVGVMSPTSVIQWVDRYWVRGSSQRFQRSLTIRETDRGERETDKERAPCFFSRGILDRAYKRREESGWTAISAHPTLTKSRVFNRYTRMDACWMKILASARTQEISMGPKSRVSWAARSGYIWDSNVFGTVTSALSRFRDLCIGIEGKVSFFESEDSFRIVAQYIGHRYQTRFWFSRREN